MKMPKNPQLTRRSFLKTSAGTAGAVLAAPYVGWRSTASGASPAKDLRVASFGAARRAWKDIEGIMAVPNTSLVSVAEVDDNHLKDLSATYPGTKVYKDWRVMLDKEAKNLDAVVIGTPDHMHAPIAMNAMQAGLQIYCEKPLTRTVYEARKLREYAEANELVTQLENQNSQGDPNQTTVQVLRDGLLGAVTEIHCMQQKTWGSMDPLEPPSAPPPGLDWDLWLGVRPERPFVAEEFHPRMWRSRLGFGCGNLGDMGCHIFHPWYLGLDLDAPETIESFGPSGVNDETWPTEVRVRWEIPGSKVSGGKRIKVTWHDGGQMPPEYVLKAIGGIQNLTRSGSVIIGEQGVLVSPHGMSGKVRLFNGGKEAKEAVQQLTGPGDHHGNFAAAVRDENGGKPPLCHWGYSGRMAEAVLLGTYSVRVPGVKLQWDTSNLRFTNSEAANALVREPYRKGWEFAGL